MLFYLRFMQGLRILCTVVVLEPFLLIVGKSVLQNCATVLFLSCDTIQAKLMDNLGLQYGDKDQNANKETLKEDRYKTNPKRGSEQGSLVVTDSLQ